jgi:hypothetical protein
VRVPEPELPEAALPEAVAPGSRFPPAEPSMAPAPAPLAPDWGAMLPPVRGLGAGLEAADSGGVTSTAVAGTGAGSGWGAGVPAARTAALSDDDADGSEHDPSHSGSIQAATAAAARVPGVNIMNAPHFQLSHVPVSTLRRCCGGRNMC